MVTTTILSRRKDISTILKNSFRATWTVEELYVQSNDVETTIRCIALGIANKDDQR
jgi:hypothetical protein